jgi:hypothetical protein
LIQEPFFIAAIMSVEASKDSWVALRLPANDFWHLYGRNASPRGPKNWLILRISTERVSIDASMVDDKHHEERSSNVCRQSRGDSVHCALRALFS